MAVRALDLDWQPIRSFIYEDREILCSVERPLTAFLDGEDVVFVCCVLERTAVYHAGNDAIRSLANLDRLSVRGDDVRYRQLSRLQRQRLASNKIGRAKSGQTMKRKRAARLGLGVAE